MAVTRSLSVLALCFGTSDAVAIKRQQNSQTLATAESGRPVTKVVTLLKGMLKQLDKEAEEDEEIYDKLACWCETNDKEKTKSIKDAEERIVLLGTTIEEMTALSAQLNTEVDNLGKEVAANQEALAEATTMREKQLAEFNAEEKDLIQSISSLKAAVTVLANKQGSSLLQAGESHLVAASLRRAFDKHASMARSTLTSAQQTMALSLLQDPGDDHFNDAPIFKQSYAPQSGEIFGILSQMKETFEKNLAQSQSEERDNQLAFEDLKAAKEGEIKSGQDQVSAKTQTLATTDEKNANSNEDIEDTRESLTADEQFLSMLKEKCQMTDAEWSDRQKTRQQEMEAVSKALEVLNGDDAHDTFSRTFNPALIQVQASSSHRAAAARVLETAAQKFHAPFLAALATRVKLDAFDRVKKAIDDLVSQLGKEKAAEIKHKDFCVDEFNSNKLDTEKKDKEMSDNEAQINDLASTVKTLTREVAGLKGEIAEMQVQLKSAGEDREAQNKEFQNTVADQKETQRLLTAALTVLQDFYGKAEAALLQRREPAGPPPPAGFEEYKKSASSGGVMGLIQQIIADSKAMEGEAARAEAENQNAYEAFVKDTNGSVNQKGKEIVNKSEEKAKAEGELVEAQKEKEALSLELENLANSKTELHQSCDFLIQNFDLRQQARDDEVEALRQAKAILSGAK